MKKKIEMRRQHREIRKAIKTLHATSVEEALWEALRFRCEPPEWLDRPMHHGAIVSAKYFTSWTQSQPKQGDLAGERYFVDMTDKYVRAVVTLLRVAPPRVISKLGYYFGGESNLIYGVSRYTYASSSGFEIEEAHREGDGWVHHTIRANANAWRDACRKAGGDARFSVTDQAYDSDHSCGVVPHGHKMALLSNGEELYPQWRVVA